MKDRSNNMKLLAGAVMALVLVGCMPGQEQEESVDQEQAAAVFAVNTISAARGPITDYIRVNGDIKAASSVDVFPDVPGKIDQINVRIGQRVTSGQVLALVDPSRPGASFARSPVKAPISGTITALPAQRGSVAAPSIPVAVVSQIENLEIVTRISERYVSRVALGQRAELELEAWPELSFGARVIELSPVLDPMTRSMEVRLAIDRQDIRIKAGMYARVKLIVENKDDILKLPADALVNRFGEPYVFVVENGHVSQRRITPGIVIDNMMEVVAGVSEGEIVVIRGQTLLEDGALVRVIQQLAPLGSAEELK